MTTAIDHDVTRFGAVPDARTLNTAAVQAALDAAAAAGGGRVVVPAGVFRSGALFLRQGVELHVARGGVLLGSNVIDDYPRRPTRIEGHVEPWRVALLNAANLTGLRVTGEGTVDGNGLMFWAAFWQRRREDPNCTNLEVERPRLMFLDSCRDVYLGGGLTLRDSGFWTVHLYRCRDVLVERAKIFSPSTVPVRAPSTDGIDVDSCQRVVIRGCEISVDDDCVAIKGSKGPTADRDPDSPPVEDVTVEDCTFGDGHGVVTVGSEATVVRRITVRNCRVTGRNAVVRLKLRPDTPQLYENLLFESIRLSRETAGGAGAGGEGGGQRGAPGGDLFDVQPWTQFFDLQGHVPPKRVVRNLTVRDVTGEFGGLGIIAGNPGDVIENVTLQRVHLRLERTRLKLGPVNNLVLDDVSVNGKPLETEATPRKPEP